MARPEALITTPNEFTECPDHGTVGVRYEGDLPGRTFAHCPDCGATDLVDTRSPFEVLIEAHNNWQAIIVTDETTANLRMGRYDVLERVAKVARDADPAHCGDCQRKAAVAAHIIRFVLGVTRDLYAQF